MAKKTSKDAAKNAQSVLAALGSMQSTSEADMFSDFFGVVPEEDKKEIDAIDIKKASREINENTEGYMVVDVNDLVPNPLSKFHMREDESWESIREMMRRHGFVKGFLITGVRQPDGKIRIISGHRRCAIAKSIGITKVPVMLMEITSEAEEIDLVLAANHSRGESVTDLLKNYILCGARYDEGVWDDSEKSAFKTKRAFVANKMGYPESKIINHEFLLHYDPKLWILIDERVLTVNDVRKIYTQEKRGELTNVTKVFDAMCKDKKLFDRSVPLDERRVKAKGHLSKLEKTGKRSGPKAKAIRQIVKPVADSLEKGQYVIPAEEKKRAEAKKEVRRLISMLEQVERDL